MAQTIVSTRKHTHPLIITGDSLWRDYMVSVTIAPESRQDRCGLVFRYRNDRCYYFFGVIGDQAVLRMVQHATAFHKPYERDLMKADYTWQPGQDLIATVTVEADHIVAEMTGGIRFEVYDSTFARGKVSLLSDVPCGYKHVKVSTWQSEKQHLDETKARREERERQLQDANPRLLLWKKIRFQIHDLDGDGKNEVMYCMNFEIVVADGKTGATKYKAPTPRVKREMKFDRILGDCLYFCDLRGIGSHSDIIIKDRYWNLWALNDKLETMWTGDCVTGHYPFAYDVDQDGKDELMVGYTLFDDNGRKLWSLDDKIRDHADGVVFVKPREDLELRLLCGISFNIAQTPPRENRPRHRKKFFTPGNMERFS